MKKSWLFLFIFFLLQFMAGVVQAAPSCRALFALSPLEVPTPYTGHAVHYFQDGSAHDDYNQRDATSGGLITVNGADELLELTQYGPGQLKPFRGAVLPVYQLGVRDFIAPRWAHLRSKLSSSINWIYEKFHEAGLKAIYQKYGPRVDPKIVEAVIEVEKQLRFSRQETFLLTQDTLKPEDRKVLGFMRIHEGSYAHPDHQDAENDLPLESILKRMGKSTTIVNRERYSQGREIPSKHVFEIGKYFIEHEGVDPKTQSLIRHDLHRWLLSQLKSNRWIADSTYFVHVASKAHEVAYRRNYGFQVALREHSTGLDADENILMINGADLLRRIQKIVDSADEKLVQLDIHQPILKKPAERFKSEVNPMPAWYKGSREDWIQDEERLIDAFYDLQIGANLKVAEEQLYEIYDALEVPFSVTAKDPASYGQWPTVQPSNPE